MHAHSLRTHKASAAASSLPRQVAIAALAKRARCLPLRAAASSSPASPAGSEAAHSAATPDKQQALLRAMGAAASHTALTLVMALAWAAPDAMAANELGKQVFNNNCAACHQGGRNSVINEKTLDKDALEKYLAGGFKLESIVYQVQNGKGAMPAWGNVLEDEEIEAVAQYVFETATAGTWASQ